MPNGEQCLGEGCSLCHAEAGRDGQALSDRSDRVFSVAAAVCQCADRVARVPVFDRVAGGDDSAGDLQAEDRGCIFRWRVQARPLQQVCTVNAGGC